MSVLLGLKFDCLWKVISQNNLSTEPLRRSFAGRPWTVSSVLLTSRGTLGLQPSHRFASPARKLLKLGSKGSLCENLLGTSSALCPWPPRLARATEPWAVSAGSLRFLFLLRRAIYGCSPNYGTTGFNRTPHGGFHKWGSPKMDGL